MTCKLWLLTSQGPPGSQGDQGPPGERGGNGTPGRQGEPGQKGEQGETVSVYNSIPANSHALGMSLAP